MKHSKRKSNRFGHWLVGATFVAAFAASVLLLSGCGDTPVSPAGADNGLVALQFMDHTYGDVFASAKDGGSGKLMPNLLRDAEALLVSEEGGLLSVDLGEKTASLTIPESGLEESSLIVMNAVQVLTPWGATTVFDFGPDGLIFKSPAQLSLETSAPEGSIQRMFWWNPGSSRWELKESSAVHDGVVTFSIHHFSKYGIN